VIGHFKERSFTQFCKELSRFYGVNVEAVPGGPKKVSSAALISGGAHKYIYDAACAKADCFITGSRDEPTWHQSFEWKINFAAVGHYASEVIGIRLLGEHLAKKFKLKCSFIQEVNPF
jgi:putative NIF3 family GTP cyclohydrolase 1 type 2